MLRAAWRVRIEVALALVLVFGAGFGIGWLNARTLTRPSPPVAPASSPTPIEKIVEKTRLTTTPVCGPAGITKDDIKLACSEGWIGVDEARLLGLDVEDRFRCQLSDDDARALKRDEDAAVAASARTHIDSRLCAPSAISADAIRLACKNRKISFDFARQFGIDARSVSSHYSGGCELSPVELQTLERDEAAAVKSPR
jgi:hypothetical protein